MSGDSIDFLGYGAAMLRLIERLFPVPRSLTGEGNRQTLRILRESLPSAELQIFDVASKTRAFDWEIPLEWKECARRLSPHPRWRKDLR
ncbi:MAG: DUF4910 domain-containing protein, partial [Helicobacter sp.]|nr:DUF4910 domain-containing protein [Helicobacter sp.]